MNCTAHSFLCANAMTFPALALHMLMMAEWDLCTVKQSDSMSPQQLNKLTKLPRPVRLTAEETCCHTCQRHCQQPTLPHTTQTEQTRPPVTSLTSRCALLACCTADLACCASTSWRDLSICSCHRRMAAAARTGQGRAWHGTAHMSASVSAEKYFSPYRYFDHTLGQT